MRKPRTNKLDNIDTGQIILFTRPRKDGTLVSQLGFVCDVDEDNNEAVQTVQVMPLVPSNSVKKLPIKAFEINETTAQYCGLDTPHLVLGMGVNIPASEFQNDEYRQIGFIVEHISDRILAFADDRENENPNYFKLTAKALGGINLPFHEVETLRTNFATSAPNKPATDNTEQSAQDNEQRLAPLNQTKGHYPADAWDVQGKDLLIVGPGR